MNIRSLLISPRIIAILTISFLSPFLFYFQTNAATTSTGCAITAVGKPQGEKPVCKTSSGTGLPGQPLPSDNPEEIKQALCNDYNVCPTSNSESAPDQDWTLTQLTALWNVVQKIYSSPDYKAYAIGNYTLEVTRAGCYPKGCDDTWGYYAGLAYPSWNTKAGARLVVITDNVPKDGAVAKIEWLIAHEIGHGASGGNVSGELLDCLSCNETAKQILACKSPVSNYSSSSDNEYTAEAISYYMTTAEEVNEGYNGSGGNIKTDFSCIYNAAMTGYFGDVEF